MAHAACVLAYFQVLQCLHFSATLKGSSLSGIHLHQTTCEGPVSQANDPGETETCSAACYDVLVLNVLSKDKTMMPVTECN